MNVMSIKPVKVVEIIRLAEDTYLLKTKLLTHINQVSPFNFFMVWVPQVDEMPLSIAFKENNILYFLFKVVGQGTESLSRLDKGQIIGLKGPLGKSFVVNDQSKNVLIIAGGIGIAPIPFFIHRSKCKNIDLIWGVKRKEELFNLDQIAKDIRERYRLIIATEDCSHGFCGTVVDVVKSMVLEEYDIVIAVGPDPMLKNLCNYMQNKNVEAYVALNTIVKCGIGICGSCFIRSTSKLLCLDGPVFRCNEVMTHLRETLDSKNI